MLLLWTKIISVTEFFFNFKFVQFWQNYKKYVSKICEYLFSLELTISGVDYTWYFKACIQSPPHTEYITICKRDTMSWHETTTSEMINDGASKSQQNIVFSSVSSESSMCKKQFISLMKIICKRNRTMIMHLYFVSFILCLSWLKPTIFLPH